MGEQNILAILKRIGAVIEGSHFVYNSGNHSSVYINKDALYPEIEESDLIAQAIAEQFADDEISVVLGSVGAGALLARDVARKLMVFTGRKVMPIYADKSEDGLDFVIRHGYDKVIIGERVLVVEDLLITGVPVRRMIEVARDLGAGIVGLGAVCNRGEVTSEDVGNPKKFFSLVEINIFLWSEEHCPLCRQGIPINTEVGRGQIYLERKRGGGTITSSQ